MSRHRRLRLGVPLWLGLRSDPRRRRYKSLTRDIDVDVAIVGGGLTGATIAWTFAHAGLRVALLESALVGRGSTAANSALLMQEPDKDLGDLTRRYGRRAARRIWQLGREATRDFIAVLRRLDIACDLVERDSVYYTVDPEDAVHLRAEHRRRRAAGFDSRWLTPSALERATGIAGAGAIHTSGNAQLDPYRACLGLLAAASRSGAQVFERSAVDRVVQQRDGVVAVTPRGSVVSKQIVVATGFATPAFKPLAGRFRMKHTYVVATERISRRLRSRIGLGDLMLWDTERPYHYGRWTPDHRLLFGGGDRLQLPARRRADAFATGVRDLRDRFRRLLPALADVEIELAWEGLFAMTPDSLPYIGPHRRYPRHLFALGYGGNGMTFGFLAARLLLDWIRGERSRDHELFAFNRHH